MESFGEIIRNKRKEKKLPLRTVAEFLDIDTAILSKIERGQRKAAREMVKKCSAYFETDESPLLIAWISDKLAYEVRDEEDAMQALEVAEEKVLYQKRSITNPGEIINILADFFEKDGRVSKAWIFGSFARGEIYSNHDIDLMVRYSDKASGTLFDYADIKFRLENLLKQKIDIVEEGFVQPFATESIDRDKILIYG
jgi:predicted nucleotidyltransferase/plasmid maintenance system antidote protein VapI